MDEKEQITYPYYETSYLDDNNTKHIAYVREEDLSFYKERFIVLDNEYKKS